MLRDCVVLGGGRRIDIALDRQWRYRLCYVAGARVWVEYWNSGQGHRRRVRGRESAYDFKSVEQLRYDFEQDAKNAQHPG